jgi:hypothetical protein
MSLFTVSQIKAIIANNSAQHTEIIKQAYDALINALEDDHVIDMKTAFSLH